MSGGYFDYSEYSLLDILEKINKLIEENNYSLPTINKFKEIAVKLESIHYFVQDIDYLVCGDTSEETFLSTQGN